MTTSALPSELDDDAHSHSGRHQLQKEHSGDLEAHFLHVGHLHPCHPDPDQHCFVLSLTVVSQWSVFVASAGTF